MVKGGGTWWVRAKTRRCSVRGWEFGAGVGGGGLIYGLGLEVQSWGWGGGAVYGIWFRVGTSGLGFRGGCGL